ncbi:hypothetical protein K435DRAFT_649862, partial [Dendrothele bispora CBS 962.96]
HINVSIASNEKRSSIMQFTSAGIFRWVTNGMMSDLDFLARAPPELRERWEKYRRNIWNIGCEFLYSSL